MDSVFRVLRAKLDQGVVVFGKVGRERAYVFVMEGIFGLGVGSVEGNGCRWGYVRCTGVATS